MSKVNIVRLRTEYKENPLGIDVRTPRLSWNLESEVRGQRQTAYRVLAASSHEALAADRGDLWDSGRVESEDCLHVEYAGVALTSRQDCFWKVRIWDMDGAASAWSDPACWTMGLLDATDWRARWIGHDLPPRRVPDASPEMTFDGCAWVSDPREEIVHPARDSVFGFRGAIGLRNVAIRSARALVSSGHQFTLFVNGVEAGQSDGRSWAFRRGSRIDLTPFVKNGDNTVALRVTYPMGALGVIGKFEVDYADGVTDTFCVDTEWTCCENPPARFEQPDFDASASPKAREVAKAHEGAWGPLGNGILDVPAPSLLRKEFHAPRAIVRATAYASALGIYELRLNGQRVGDDLLTPGWSDYHKRVYYQTYDVTALLHEGPNAIGALLGHGWYSGYAGWGMELGKHYATPHPRALVQVEIQYDDGTTETIASDATWKGSSGPILCSDLYMGETCDLRKEMPGWDKPGFDAQSWRPVAVDATAPSIAVQAYPGVQVHRIMELPARTIAEPKPGVFVFDIGQNIVGWARVRLRGGERGRKITLRFAEALNPDGTIYVENLRGARATDELWLNSDPDIAWEPKLTFHGFRYVEVTGCPGTPPLDAVIGVVVHSDTPLTGEFWCSDPIVNQLHHNIQWGQRGNFLEVPTDCPQRDERLGWMGDAQVFCRTASFNMDTAAFFTKWMQDVEDSQSSEGGFADVAPRVVVPYDAAPAWGDAGVIVPWTIYQCYGDTRIVARHYDAMARWMDYQLGGSKDLIRTDRLNSGYGDWLSIDAVTPQDLIATAYFAYDARLMAKMADTIGKADDAAKYAKWFEDIKAAFIRTYVGEDGKIAGGTQTAYVLALQFDLLPQELRAKAVDHLVADIEARNGHLSTGFVGCSCIPFALSENGRLDVAYRLLANTTFPSWCYAVCHGATTIWERWDGWTAENGFQNPDMNSFNHYAYGAIGEWLHRVVAGIDLEAPGYKRIRVHPRPGGAITSARATLRSSYGVIATEWKYDNGRFLLDVTIPCNTKATVHVPTSSEDSVTVDGSPLVQASNVEKIGRERDGLLVGIGSGNYRFEAMCKYPPA